MAVMPTKKLCGNYHDEPMCQYCVWIAEDNAKVFWESPEGNKLSKKLKGLLKRRAKEGK
jgi:hypothetical protein